MQVLYLALMVLDKVIKHPPRWLYKAVGAPAISGPRALFIQHMISTTMLTGSGTWADIVRSVQRSPFALDGTTAEVHSLVKLIAACMCVSK
jgi:hypothetical protein